MELNDIIQTVVTLIIGALFSYVIIMPKQIKAIKLGLQMLLRGEMLRAYDKWSIRGYAPVPVREIFLAQYNAYEALGADGVILDIKEKFLALDVEPTYRQENKEDK